MISDEDFYGDRTGPLEKFYLFIFFNDFGWRFLRWSDGAIRKKKNFFLNFFYLIFFLNFF